MIRYFEGYESEENQGFIELLSDLNNMLSTIRSWGIHSMNTAALLEQIADDPNGIREVQNFYPLSRLPLFSLIIDEQLEHAHEQLALLQQVKAMPHILNDEAVARIIKPYMGPTNSCCQQQLNRWQAQTPSESQQQEVERLVSQIAQFEQCRHRILSLVKVLKNHSTASV